jgi:hypothetical protein
LEAAVVLLVIVLLLATLGRASLSSGVDSREPYADDHTR